MHLRNKVSGIVEILTGQYHHTQEDLWHGVKTCKSTIYLGASGVLEILLSPLSYHTQADLWHGVKTCKSTIYFERLKPCMHAFISITTFLLKGDVPEKYYITD